MKIFPELELRDYLIASKSRSFIIVGAFLFAMIFLFRGVIADSVLQPKLTPNYFDTLPQNTNRTMWVEVNPSDGLSSVVSAYFKFKIFTGGSTTNYTLYVNSRLCGVFYVSTTYANSGQYEIFFDCTHIINSTGNYSVKLKSNTNAGSVFGLLELTYKNNPHKLDFFGTEYQVGDAVTVWLFFTNSTNQPVSNASCYATIYYPDKTLLIQNMLMSYLDSGIFYYDFIAPEQLGVYMVYATCHVPKQGYVDEFVNALDLESYWNITISNSKVKLVDTFATMERYNFTTLAGKSAYKKTTDNVATPLPWANGWDGTNLSSSDYSNLANTDWITADTLSSSTNLEPWMRFNFSLDMNKHPLSTINEIWVDIELEKVGGSGEDCAFEIANFTSQNWVEYASRATQTGVISYGFKIYDSGFSDIIDANNNLVLLTNGINSDNNEGCKVDFAEVRVNYTVPSTNYGFIQSKPIILEGLNWISFNSSYDLQEGNIQFSVLDNNNNTICSGLGNIADCANITSPVKIYANLSRTFSYDATPEIERWFLIWNQPVSNTLEGMSEIHISQFPTSSFISATEYVSGENGSFILQFFTTEAGRLKPINDGLCYGTFYYPNGSIWISDRQFVYRSGTNGLYFTSETVPDITGVYTIDGNCSKQGIKTYASSTFHINPALTDLTSMNISIGNMSGMIGMILNATIYGVNITVNDVVVSGTEYLPNETGVVSAQFFRTISGSSNPINDGQCNVTITAPALNLTIYNNTPMIYLNGSNGIYVKIFNLTSPDGVYVSDVYCTRGGIVAFKQDTFHLSNLIYNRIDFWGNWTNYSINILETKLDVMNITINTILANVNSLTSTLNSMYSVLNSTYSLLNTTYYYLLSINFSPNITVNITNNITVNTTYQTINITVINQTVTPNVTFNGTVNVSNVTLSDGSVDDVATRVIQYLLAVRCKLFDMFSKGLFGLTLNNKCEQNYIGGRE